MSDGLSYRSFFTACQHVVFSLFSVLVPFEFDYILFQPFVSVVHSMNREPFEAVFFFVAHGRTVKLRVWSFFFFFLAGLL